LAAILTDELSGPATRNALVARRCYGTSGPRILLRFAVGGARMGGVLPAAQALDATLFAQVIATAPIKSIDIVTRGERILSLPGDSLLEFAASATLADLRAGDWVYLRVVQVDGGMAWTSPIFVE
jgi:hypothetical protein